LINNHHFISSTCDASNILSKNQPHFCAVQNTFWTYLAVSQQIAGRACRVCRLLTRRRSAIFAADVITFFQLQLNGTEPSFKTRKTGHVTKIEFRFSFVSRRIASTRKIPYKWSIHRYKVKKLHIE